MWQMGCLRVERQDAPTASSDGSRLTHPDLGAHTHVHVAMYSRSGLPSGAFGQPVNQMASGSSPIREAFSILANSADRLVYSNGRESRLSAVVVYPYATKGFAQIPPSAARSLTRRQTPKNLMVGFARSHNPLRTLALSGLRGDLVNTKRLTTRLASEPENNSSRKPAWVRPRATRRDGCTTDAKVASQRGLPSCRFLPRS